MSGEHAVKLSASAKVNLALHVTGRRPDGYHLIDSIAVFAEIGDRVEIAPSQELSLTMTGRFADHAPGDSTDLAWRAAEAFFVETRLPPKAAIRIEKLIPAGAGLGGGSADAAAVLAGLNRMFAAGLSLEDLAALGLSLGADIPMCLAGRVSRVRGIGERIECLENWPALPMLLAWPGRPVATAACFGALARRDNSPLPQPEAAETPADAALWLAACRNDLEVAALCLEPVVGDVLAALRGTAGSLVARMSGSGSACFCIYSSVEAAELAALTVARDHPDWWLAPTLARRS